MTNIPDPAINDFVQDPWRFIATKLNPDQRAVLATAVSSYNIFPAHQGGKSGQELPGRVPSQGYFYFVLDYEDDDNTVPRRRTYEIKYFGPDSGPNTVWAYNLGYNGGAQTSRTPAFIDIPKTVAEKTLLFTGTLSGCSVIVTRLDDHTYRVFHDSREDSSLLYDNVEMAVDYSNYSISNAGMACAFMQYRNRRWNLYVQLQTLEAAQGRTIVVPRKTQANLGLYAGFFLPIDAVPGSYDSAEAKSSFEVRREMNRDQLRRVASEALYETKIPDVPDDAFVPFEDNEIKLENPGVRHSQAIRDVINAAQGGLIAQYVQEQESTEYPLLSGMLQMQRQNLKQLVNPTKRESEDLDYIHLWIKQKEVRGFDAVVVVNGSLESRRGSTAGERLVGQELDMVVAASNDFATGWRDYRTTDIPGFSPDMTALEMTIFFDLTSSLTQIKQGAVVHWIAIANEQNFQKTVRGQTDTVVTVFKQGGGTITPVPQDFLLNAVPDEYGGRCYPLVRAMAIALALSNSAVKELVAKFVALASGTEPKNAELLRRCLKDLTASYPATQASIEVLQQVTINDAVEKLTILEGTSVMFTLNTEIHAMILGATNRAGKTAYHFYDPNFVVATFTSQETLSNAITEFFVDLKFGDVYGAGGSRSNPVFTLVKIDTNQLARISSDFKLAMEDLPEPESLTQSVGINAATAFNLPAPGPSQSRASQAFGTGASLMKGLHMAEAWRAATVKAQAVADLDECWMPIIETTEAVEGSGTWTRFVKLEDPSQTCLVASQDARIKLFKKYLDETLGALGAAYTFEHDILVAKLGIPHSDVTRGLKSAFVLKALTDHFKTRNRKPQEGVRKYSYLATALLVHTYIHLTPLGRQALNDPAKVVGLASSLIKTAGEPESSLATIAQAVGCIAEEVGSVLVAKTVDQEEHDLARDADSSMLLPPPGVPEDVVVTRTPNMSGMQADIPSTDVPSPAWLEKSMWLGTDLNGNIGYFYSSSSGAIYATNMNAPKQPAKIVQYVTKVVRTDEALFLVPRGPEFDLTSQWRNRYAKPDRPGTGRQASWAYYCATVVLPEHTSGSDKVKLVRIDLENHEELLAKQMGEDLVIVDLCTGRNVRFWKAFGSDPVHSHVALQFAGDGTVVRPADVLSAQTWLQGLVKLEAKPDVSLAAVYYHIEHPVLEVTWAEINYVDSAGT